VQDLDRNRKLVTPIPISAKVGSMERFCEFFTRAKVAVVEIASLVGFVGIVVFGVYFEVHTLVVLLHR
jgi:hypothetical protein